MAKRGTALDCTAQLELFFYEQEQCYVNFYTTSSMTSYISEFIILIATR